VCAGIVAHHRGGLSKVNKELSTLQSPELRHRLWPPPVPCLDPVPWHQQWKHTYVACHERAKCGEEPRVLLLPLLAAYALADAEQHNAHITLCPLVDFASNLERHIYSGDCLLDTPREVSFAWLEYEDLCSKWRARQDSRGQWGKQISHISCTCISIFFPPTFLTASTNSSFHPSTHPSTKHYAAFFDSLTWVGSGTSFKTRDDTPSSTMPQ
jgi:hypothetical protein